MGQPAHASVRGFIENEGRILLIKHRTPDGNEMWEIPGGRALIGENPRDALVREVKEETTLEITAGDPIDVYSFTWNRGTKGVVATVFDCEIVGGTVDIGDSPEDDPLLDFDWVTPNQVDSLPMLPELNEVITDQ